MPPTIKPRGTAGGILGRLRADMFVYGTALLIPKLLVILTVAVYTRWLTPTEYGTQQLGLAAAMLLVPIFTMGLDAAHSFFFFAKRPDGSPAKGEVVAAILKLRFAWGVVVLFAVLIAVWRLPFWWALPPPFPTFLIVVAVGAFLEQVSSQAADVFRLEHRPRAYAFTTALQTLGGALLGLALALGLGWGVTGLFAGTATAAGLTAASAWWRHRALLQSGRDGGTVWWPRLLRFGTPMVPFELAQMLLYSLDRWLLLAMVGSAGVAVYGAGAELAGVVALLVAAFRVAWWPIAMAEIADDRTEVFGKVATLYVGVAALVAVAAAYSLPAITRWLLPPRYADAAGVAAIVPWRWLCHGFVMIAALGTWKSERTAWSLAPIGLALIVQVAVALLLIPAWGIEGAAWAAIAGSLTWVTASLAVSERLYHIGYRYGLLAAQAGIGLSATAGLVWLSTSPMPGVAVARVVLAVTASLLIAATLRGVSFRASAPV